LNPTLQTVHIPSLFILSQLPLLSRHLPPLKLKPCAQDLQGAYYLLQFITPLHFPFCKTVPNPHCSQYYSSDGSKSKHAEYYF